MYTGDAKVSFISIHAIHTFVNTHLGIMSNEMLTAPM